MLKSKIKRRRIAKSSPNSMAMVCVNRYRVRCQSFRGLGGTWVYPDCQFWIGNSVKGMFGSLCGMRIGFLWRSPTSRALAD